MNKSQEILRAYAAEKLQDAGFEPHPASLEAVSRLVHLQEGQSDERKEERSVTIKEDTEVSARHFSWYNMMKVDFYDLFGLGLDALPVMAMRGEPALQITYALLKLIYEFYPKLTYDFNTTDARILLAVFHLRQKEFTLEEVSQAYQDHFDETIEAGRLKRAVGFFCQKFIMNYQGDGRYRVEEQMTYERA